MTSCFPCRCITNHLETVNVCDLQVGNLGFKKGQLFGMKNGISLKMKVQCYLHMYKSIAKPITQTLTDNPHTVRIWQ